jgi:dehydrogenase/reductase SDR family member 12
MLSSIIDRALDFSVVGGYTRIGYALRSSAWDDVPRLDGRTVMVTGSTSGLGRATVEMCASLGARVLLLARDPRKGERTLHEVAARTGNDDLGLVVCDLSSLDSVRDAAATILDQEAGLHALVNNAGVMAAERTLSPDGIELTFAVNVVGTWLLTELLLDRLSESATAAPYGRARVVTVTSGGMYAQKLDTEDLQTAHRDYDPPGVYARSKRAQVVLTERWARDWAGGDVVFHAMHPGWANTPGVTQSLPRFDKVMGPLLRTPAEGADTAVWLCAAREPAFSSGRLWHDRRARPVDRVRWTKTTEHDADVLQSTVQRLTA